MPAYQTGVDNDENFGHDMMRVEVDTDIIYPNIRSRSNPNKNESNYIVY